MFTERVSPNVIAVVDFNGGEIGHITKSVGCFYARKLGERRATLYATEEQAAAHFGFNPPVSETVTQPYNVRGFARAIGVVSVVLAPVAFLCVCLSNQAAGYGIRAAAMLAGM